MIDCTLSDLAQIVAGVLHGRDRPWRGVSIDTRTLMPGNLFAALAGSHQDGHAFVGQAFAAGAAGVLVSRVPEAGCEAAVVVPDPLRALGRLAHTWRRRFGAPVAAITGSSGKTTVKDMLSAILGQHARVLATSGNLNNQIGVPLTLLNGPDDPEYVVLELGTSAHGEIAQLASMVEPDLALVTNAQAAHLEGLGTVDQVAHEKGTLYESLSANGIAVLSAEDPYAPLWRKSIGKCRIVSYGMAKGDLHLAAPLQWDARKGMWNGTVCLGEDTCPLELFLLGRHNAMNALAAMAAAHAWSIPIETSARALARFRPVARRLERRRGPDGFEIIDDSYNANPHSVIAGIDAALALGPPLWLVIGELAELGPESSIWHRDLGQVARARGVRRVYATGQATQDLVHGFGKDGYWFQTPDALLDGIKKDLGAGPAVILVKGSHRSRMDRVADALSVKGGAHAHLAY
ncbi:MAG: UDP-N-acetylmuramoyl-tripeptide--D-alanyl-D-alanine ligase [Gammaproteobacteria bacterium]